MRSGTQERSGPRRSTSAQTYRMPSVALALARSAMWMTVAAQQCAETGFRAVDLSGDARRNSATRRPRVATAGTLSVVVQEFTEAAPHSRIAFSSIASNTGARSPGEELMTCSTSAVAVSRQRLVTLGLLRPAGCARQAAAGDRR